MGNSVYSEYNGDLLTPEQIEMLHGALMRDLAEWGSGPDAEDEAGADPADGGEPDGSALEPGPEPESGWSRPDPAWEGGDYTPPEPGAEAEAG